MLRYVEPELGVFWGPPMMAVIFATMSVALVTGWFGRRSLAIVLVAVALVLAVHLFLWEIHSPEYGFRTPWIQT
jgi:asparagine N-glycosylation enzyme membrane subunit Stt3